MTEPDKNDPVSRTTMTLTILHRQELDPSKMHEEDLANRITTGDFVASRTGITTVALSDAAVDGELVEIGGTPGHFAAKGPFIRNPIND